MDPKFVIKLCSDEFWEGAYLQQGAVALIPDVVRNLCHAGKGDIITKGIPPSIRELFRQNAGAKSYAEKKYARFTKPSSGMREAFVDPYDEDSEYEEDAVEPEVEWSEGEGTDASGYNTEEMTDVDDDDDATIRGAESDDEMTEVEEWVPKPSKPAAKVKVVTREDLEEEMRKLDEFGEEIRQLLELEKKPRLEMEWDHELEERKYAFFSDGP
jgi:hypothetical protein